MCGWLSFQTKEALFAALRLTFYVNYKRVHQLMAIFRSVSDSTRVIARIVHGTYLSIPSHSDLCLSHPMGFP